MHGVLGGSAETSVYGEGSMASLSLSLAGSLEGGGFPGLGLAGGGWPDQDGVPLSSSETFPSVFSEIDKSGSIHSRSNLFDPWGQLKPGGGQITEGGQYNPDGSINRGYSGSGPLCLCLCYWRYHY